MKVGPRTLRTTIEISSIETARSITWSSTGDSAQRLTFDLHPDGDETSVLLAVSYEEPGGLSGPLLAPFVEQTVRHRAVGTLDRLRALVSPPAS